MKAFKLLLVLVSLLCFTSLVGAEETNENCLTVYGKVTVIAKADRATISFQIKSEAKSLRAAFEGAHAKINAIMIQLKEIGLDESNLSTSFFESRENKGNKAFLSSKRDYKVTQTALVTTDRLDLLKEVVIILSENQVEWISNISFELVNSDDLRKKAVKEAVAKAEAKAQVMVAELGSILGRVISITEYNESEPSDLDFRDKNRSYGHISVLAEYYTDNSPSIFASDNNFDVNVKVRFEIDNQ